jgi:hypothetical protein
MAHDALSVFRPEGPLNDRAWAEQQMRVTTIIDEPLIKLIDGIPSHMEFPRSTGGLLSVPFALGRETTLGPTVR